MLDMGVRIFCEVMENFPFSQNRAVRMLTGGRWKGLHAQVKVELKYEGAPTWLLRCSLEGERSPALNCSSRLLVFCTSCVASFSLLLRFCS